MPDTSAETSARAPARDDRPMFGGRRATGIGMGVLGAIVVTVIGIAAGSGSPLATSPRVVPNEAPSLPIDASAGPHRTFGTPAGSSGGAGHNTVLEVGLRVLFVAVALFCLLALIVVIVRLFLGRGSDLIRRRVLEPEEIEMMLTSVGQGVDAPRSSDVDEALAHSRAALLDGADVRAAVIAAWVRLEQIAVEVGTDTRETDTPTDLVGRLLSEQHVGAPALERLANLYRRARYSPAPLEERDRIEALGALDSVRVELGDPSRLVRPAASAPLVAPRRRVVDPGRWV